ncbi:hypothetical protein B9Z55_027596 [Caenorhabditis nigoni]|uniref:Uncharacterized protein n=1 Tax=Caenorhabditis nigoni TaxID=1611254 RepID=A0A2G5SFD8_9PELO|nr:hypothetical protein B9Z55_027596 [Caenorhabditis nigoni]
MFDFNFSGKRTDKKNLLGQRTTGSGQNNFLTDNGNGQRTARKWPDKGQRTTDCPCISGTIPWNMLFEWIEAEDEKIMFTRSALMRSLAKAERELQIIQRKQMNLTGPVAPESVKAVERCF